MPDASALSASAMEPDEGWTIDEIVDLHESVMWESLRTLMDGRTTESTRKEILSWVRDTSPHGFSFRACCCICRVSWEEMQEIVLDRANRVEINLAQRALVKQAKVAEAEARAKAIAEVATLALPRFDQQLVAARYVEEAIERAIKGPNLMVLFDRVQGHLLPPDNSSWSDIRIDLGNQVKRTATRTARGAISAAEGFFSAIQVSLQLVLPL